MAESSKGRFDPSKHLQRLQGQEYLPVKFRIVWVRTEHPDAQIITELVNLDMETQFAVFKATVLLPDGASATGYGSESVKDFKDWVEKAETKAVGRALGMLGYGTQFSHDFDESENGKAQAPARSQAQAPAYRLQVSPSLYRKAPEAQAESPSSPEEEPAQDSHTEKVRFIRDWARIHEDNQSKVLDFVHEEQVEKLQQLPESKLDELMARYDITRSPQAS